MSFFFRSSASAQATHDRNRWTDGWEPHPLVPAAPRWTFGKVSFGSQAKGTSTDGSSGTPRKRRAGHRARETYLDKILQVEEDMGTGENLGPGSHDPLPVERVFQQPVASVHGTKANARRDLGGGGRFNKTPCLRFVPPPCAKFPGPGAYTAHTTFGAPSGPSRIHYLPKSSPRR
eukprot:TRINITY_DN63269_c0_g1_i1.p1 TRINITY_DN63269_c0_g1~~TRINITY_DN63269_c0_g1_i1.p1  ORF type:complete len:175 (-),score=18.22 TRINITY_DN63269_c0_g1_i1:189-713(-)